MIQNLVTENATLWSECSCEWEVWMSHQMDGHWGGPARSWGAQPWSMRVMGSMMEAMRLAGSSMPADGGFWVVWLVLGVVEGAINLVFQVFTMIMEEVNLQEALGVSWKCSTGCLRQVGFVARNARCIQGVIKQRRWVMVKQLHEIKEEHSLG